MKESIIVKGTVSFIGIQDGTHNILIDVTEEQAQKILELCGNCAGCESTPIKVSKDGKYQFKAHSNFDIDVYDGGTESEILFGEIGKDSKVSVFATIKDGEFKRKKYITAYLKSVNILDYKEYVKYNPFEDESQGEI